MPGSRRIIIGTSGSPGSLSALRYAAGVARENDATLVPVLAWLPPGGDFADRAHPSGFLRQVWRDAAWLRLWAALEWPGAGSPRRAGRQPQVLRGEPGEVLVAAACEPGDLLVVGRPPRRRPPPDELPGKPVRRGEARCARSSPCARPGSDQQMAWPRSGPAGAPGARAPGLAAAGRPG